MCEILPFFTVKAVVLGGSSAGSESLMSVLSVVGILAVVAFVIGRQLVGEPLRGKRLLVLPAVLVVVGLVGLTKHGTHVSGTDVTLIVASALVAAVVGVLQGRSVRLQSRGGFLWGQVPPRSLWLWVALIASRIVVIGIAHSLGADVAASSSAIFLSLGVNRLAQAGIVTSRALAAGIPFAPEKNGTSMLSGLFAGSGLAGGATAGSRPSGPRR
jgi:hypothetical protein